MGQEAIALFFSVPDGEMQRLPVGCLLLQMFAAWIRLANCSPQGALPRPIVCYLDEFSTAGSVPRMADLIATLRARPVALVLACQGFAQVEERYGKGGAETILSNASTHLILPGVGQREAEFYSQAYGQDDHHDQLQEPAWHLGGGVSSWEGGALADLARLDQDAARAPGVGVS